MNKIIRKAAMALYMALCAATASHAALTDLKIGSAQIFDVQYYYSGTTLYVSNMIAPYASVSPGNFQHPTLTSGQYYGFFNSTTVTGTYGLGVYNSDGTRAYIVHNTGTLSKIGDGVIFYVGNGFFGTVISTSQGYAYGSSANFTNTHTPTASEITNYTPATTVPLVAGQSAAQANASNSNTNTVVTENVVTTSTVYGTATSTTTYTSGTSTVVVSESYTKDRKTKELVIDKATQTITITPITAITTTVTPGTTTTTTTPKTTTTDSNGNVVSETYGTAVTVTSDATVTTQTTNLSNNTQTTVVDTLYSTRIDQFDRLAEANKRENALLASDPLSRHRVYDGGIKLVGANVNERTVFDLQGTGSTTNRQDGYAFKSDRYSLGLTHLVRRDLLIGGTYSHSNVTMNGNDSSGMLEKNSVNLYALWTKYDWLVKSDVGFARNSYSTAHTLPSLGLANTASTNGSDAWGAVRLYTPATKEGIRAFVGIRRERNRIGSAVDAGSELSSVTYASSTVIETTKEAGLRLDRYVNDKLSLFVEASRNNQKLTTSKAGVLYSVGKNTSVQVGAVQQNQNGLRSNGVLIEIKILF